VAAIERMTQSKGQQVQNGDRDTKLFSCFLLNSWAQKSAFQQKQFKHFLYKEKTDKTLFSWSCSQVT
jgi:hypothetical protein